jgi:hypothetical protein
MFEEGNAFPQDLVRAHAWANMSAAQGFAPAAEWRDGVSKRMTPRQIAAAQAFAIRCTAAGYKDCK